MIPKADLAKAPYSTSWILNEQNIQCKTPTMVLWKPKHDKQLWFYDRLYYFKEMRVFNMDNHLCGHIVGNSVYGIQFSEKIELPFPIDL